MGRSGGGVYFPIPRPVHQSVPPVPHHRGIIFPIPVPTDPHQISPPHNKLTKNHVFLKLYIFLVIFATVLVLYNFSFFFIIKRSYEKIKNQDIKLKLYLK